MSLSNSVQYYQVPSNYAQITTNATTVVFNGAGIFYGLQAPSAGTAWTATVYDNTAASGPQLVPTTVAITAGTVATGVPTQGIAFKNGLTVVTAGTTPGILNVLFQQNQ